VTSAPIPRPSRQGKPINWKGPDPRSDIRDAEITRLAFIDGMGQTEIAAEIVKRGYEPVSPDRIGQILRSHSGRDRVIRFLASAPEGVVFTTKEIAQELRLDINKVQYVLDGLMKKGIVEFRDVRNLGTASGDHKTKMDIHLAKRARYNPMVAAAIERAAPEGDQAAPESNELGTTHTVKPSQIIAVEAEVVAAPLPIVNPMMPQVDLPWFRGNLDGWPAFRDVRDRAIKAKKLNVAAKILEEVGEDEMALRLMDKTMFSPLEKEVIDLLERFKEIA
jgi:hypothetical protein